MMFNTYDVEDGKETEENQEHRSKRNRGDITDQHTLLTVPPHAKYYEGRPVYKWKCTQKAKYQQLACSAGCKTQTRTYCRCNPYNWICKHCHVKHVVTVTNGNSSNSSQNEGNAQKRENPPKNEPKIETAAYLLKQSNNTSKLL